MLVFRPGFSSDDVFAKGLRPWIELLHAHLPGVQVILVCTRWLTTQQDEDISQHQQRISKLSEEVGGHCRELVEELNLATQEEVLRVQERMQKLKMDTKEQNYKSLLPVPTVKRRHGERLQSKIRNEIKRDEMSLQLAQRRLDVLCDIPLGYRSRQAHFDLVAKKMVILEALADLPCSSVGYI